MREVGVSAREAYDAFRLEDFPRWFDHLASVRRTGPRMSEWRLKGDPPILWQVETTQERPGQVFAWASTSGGLVTYGAAEFEPLGPARTRVRFRRFNVAPSGTSGAADAASSVAQPERKLEADLDRFVRHLTVGPAPLKPVERGGFTLGAPEKPQPTAPAVHSSVAPQAKVSFQRLGTRPPKA